MERFPEVGMTWTDMEAIDAQGQVFDPRYLRHMYTAYRWYRNRDLFAKSYSLAEIAPGIDGGLGGNRFYVGAIYSQMIMGNLVHTSTVVLRRERLEKVKAFNEAFRSGEDFDFHLRTCREGQVGFIDVSSIQYQRGLEECLDSPKYKPTIARNFLATITAAVQRDRERIELPRSMLKDVVAEANSWVGESLMDSGDRLGARGYLLKSLSYRSLQPRAMAMLALSLVPAGLGRRLRLLYGGFKRRLMPFARPAPH
jgi:hypothetical protein